MTNEVASVIARAQALVDTIFDACSRSYVLWMQLPGQTPPPCTDKHGVMYIDADVNGLRNALRRLGER